jgi:hypothetical protein
MTTTRAALLLATAAAFASDSRLPLRPEPAQPSDKKPDRVRVLDDMTAPGRWTLTGRGQLTATVAPPRPALRVNAALDNLTALPAATAVRAVLAEDWTAYNRLSFWLRTDASGFPVLTILVNIRNQGKEQVAEVHLREAEHNVTIPNGVWTRVDWEIPHVARDRVTALSFRAWVNKRLPGPSDVAAFEIGAIELQHVQANAYEGWNVAPGKFAFSHTGYLPDAPKTALATALSATQFEVLRGTTVVLRKPVERRTTRLGDFQVLDFSDLRAPGQYTLRAGTVQSRPFRIAADVWDATIAKTLNFFYAERCGDRIPGYHDLCHRDWIAAHGDQKVVMNGGWHDAGDLSQGLVNTGEADYAMWSLADAARASGQTPPWLPHLVEEARWGLDWIQRVRFPGGFRIGFASMNVWTNGVIGDADDRVANALDNPNVNYIAAAAGAAAARYLAPIDPDLARRTLAIAEDDWQHAIVGVETPATLATPAFAATDMEQAASGIVASVELYRATKKDEYARKAFDLARTVADSQQVEFVGDAVPLAGFFYTGPDRTRLFHQFHRGNDQVPIVALSLLCDTFPDHPDWMRWYAVVARYSDYQKRAAAAATAPYGVLPAYVYPDDEWQTIAENDRYGSSRAAFRDQVLGGLKMGGGWYLKSFPVWFTRRGNYGVLLSQTKALASAARLRRDRDAADLVQTQLQWVVGRNPFAQSTMWGEGYDYIPQYTVSVGDIVGSLPVGMMTRDNADRPYWPATNTYVFKEVWVHSSARWLAILQDAVAPPQSAPFTLSQATAPGGEITIAAQFTGRHTFTVRTDNLTIQPGPREGTWKARPQNPKAPWVAVVIADGNPSLRRDVSH